MIIVVAKRDSCLASRIRPARKPEDHCETVKNKTDDAIEEMWRPKLEPEGAAVNKKTPNSLKEPALALALTPDTKRVTYHKDHHPTSSSGNNRDSPRRNPQKSK